MSEEKQITLSANPITSKKEKIDNLIAEFVAMPQLKYTGYVPNKAMVIEDHEQMKVCESDIKNSGYELSRIMDYISEAKQTIDGFKAPILALEKDVTAQAKDIQSFLKLKIQEYLASVKAKQDAINGTVNLIRKVFYDLDMAQKNRDAKLNRLVENLTLEIQEIELRNAKVKKSERAEVQELLETIELQKQIVPVIVETEFIKSNVVQTRLIKENYDCSIGDEDGYVEFCIKNNLWKSHLAIKPNIAMFKAWVKSSHQKLINGELIEIKNDSLPFIKKTLKLK